MRPTRYLARKLVATLAGVALLLPLPLSGKDFFVQAGTEVVLRLHTTVDTEISQKGDRII